MPPTWTLLALSILALLAEGFNQTSPPVVVPPPVDLSTLEVSGPWNRFNVSWAPSAVDYGDVFYKVNISGLDKQVSSAVPNRFIIRDNDMTMGCYLSLLSGYGRKIAGMILVILRLLNEVYYQLTVSDYSIGPISEYNSS
jgi:hypothetical protein